MPYLVVGALVIGLSLGLFGSGGSILTVPVLIYLLGHHSKVAIAESLGIVGGIALVAAIPYTRARLIDWRSVIFFGIPGMGGTFLGAWLARFVPGSIQLTLFGMVMLLAAWMMLRNQAKADPSSEATEEATDQQRPHAIWKIVLEGLVVGIVTGLVGVGGGFLIVPALVVLGGLPIRTAVGTSLIIIALKSATGFFKYLQVLDSLNRSVDWPAIGGFILVGLVGSLVGTLIGSKLNQQRLKQGFAVFLIVMGIIIVGKEAPDIVAPRHASNDALKAQAKVTLQER